MTAWQNYTTPVVCNRHNLAFPRLPAEPYSPNFIPIPTPPPMYSVNGREGYQPVRGVPVSRTRWTVTMDANAFPAPFAQKPFQEWAINSLPYPPNPNGNVNVMLNNHSNHGNGHTNQTNHNNHMIIPNHSSPHPVGVGMAYPTSSSPPFRPPLRSGVGQTHPFPFPNPKTIPMSSKPPIGGEIPIRACHSTMEYAIGHTNSREEVSKITHMPRVARGPQPDGVRHSTFQRFVQRVTGKGKRPPPLDLPTSSTYWPSVRGEKVRSPLWGALSVMDKQGFSGQPRRRDQIKRFPLRRT